MPIKSLQCGIFDHCFDKVLTSLLQEVVAFFASFTLGFR